MMTPMWWRAHCNTQSSWAWAKENVSTDELEEDAVLKISAISHHELFSFPVNCMKHNMETVLCIDYHSSQMRNNFIFPLVKIIHFWNEYFEHLSKYNMLTKKKYVHPKCAAQWEHTHVTSSVTEALPRIPLGLNPQGKPLSWFPAP